MLGALGLSQEEHAAINELRVAHEAGEIALSEREQELMAVMVDRANFKLTRDPVRLKALRRIRDLYGPRIRGEMSEEEALEETAELWAWLCEDIQREYDDALAELMDLLKKPI